MGTKEWKNCGEQNLDSPDAQPGNFDVDLPAINGKYYLGMVARDNDTWEAISQRLDAPLDSLETYWLSLALAKSNKLVSQSRRTKKIVKYKTPLVLRIWAADKSCNKKELLAKSVAIENTDWEYFEFILNPKKGVKHIVIEAFYDTPVLMPYNGNLLIDDLSPIISLDQEKLIKETQANRKKAKAVFTLPSK